MVTPIENVVAVVLGVHRTTAGASQLSDILSAHGYDCHTVRIEGCLHLKSAVNYLGNDTMLVDDRYQDLSFLNRYDRINVDGLVKVFE